MLDCLNSLFHARWNTVQVSLQVHQWSSLMIQVRHVAYAAATEGNSPATTKPITVWAMKATLMTKAVRIARQTCS